MKTIVVEGKVQGVGYRSFCYAVASKLQTECTAENLGNGSVKIMVPDDKLKQFVKELSKSKPPLAVVKKIIIE